MSTTDCIARILQPIVYTCIFSSGLNLLYLWKCSLGYTMARRSLSWLLWLQGAVVHMLAVDDAGPYANYPLQYQVTCPLNKT